ncbi:MAG: D-2-hydroxyacid dehydrogenase [Acidimicrobiales bacterium]|nr:D-2-hydroxyacid dehydrogenase [Acidimicrobiales bacterium]
MSKRQVLVPLTVYERIHSRLEDSPHDFDVLCWSSSGITHSDGSAVAESDYRPEIGWVPIDLLFAGTSPGMTASDFLLFTEALVECGTVRWVQSCLAGADAPPLQRILSAGIRLSNSDSPNAGVAEYAMAAIMNVVHGWPQRNDDQRNGKWSQKSWVEINGGTWLIIGFGSIGGEIAKRARPFGVEVIGARRTEADDARADRMITMDTLGEVLPTADVVVVACPLTDETRGLVDKRFLDQMKDDSILVNVSRGPVVNTGDLLEALDSGKSLKAILDVFDSEPLDPSSPLWNHSGVTLTSHIAGAGSGITKRGDDVFIEQLDAYLSGRPLRLELET